MNTAPKKRNVLYQTIHPRLPLQLYKQAKTFCQSKGVSFNRLAQTAFETYLNGMDDATLLFRGQERMLRALRISGRDVALLLETFSLFLRIWFAHTPEIVASQKDASRHQAASRYQRFCDALAHNLSKGHQFLQDLPQEVVADIEELALATQGQGKGGKGVG